MTAVRQPAATAWGRCMIAARFAACIAAVVAVVVAAVDYNSAASAYIRGGTYMRPAANIPRGANILKEPNTPVGPPGTSARFRSGEARLPWYLAWWETA